MGLTQVKTTGIADDAITSAKIADDAVVAAAIADDVVAEAHIANDAISLTELKAGTDGQIITWDASGNPTAVGPGTDGQVLTSTGAGSPPAFETISIPAGVGGATGVDFNDGVKIRSGTDNDLEIYHHAGDSYIRNNGGYLSFGCTNNADIQIVTNNTERMRVANDGQVSITDGDLVIGTSGHGISFAATGQASGNTQELLDDYEEGTWTPDLYHQGAEGKSGFYTKIGRIVFASFKLQALSASGNSNHQSIASLPFTVKNADPMGGCARGWQNYASDLGPLYEPSGNGTQCYLYTNNGTNLAAQTLGTTQLRGVIIYVTDS